MNLFSTLLLSGAVVLGFFLLIDGLIYIIANSGDRGDSRRKRRLKATARATAAADSAIEKLAREERAPRKISINDYIDDLIARAGTTTRRDHVYVWMGLIAIGTFLLLLLAGSGIPIVFRILVSLMVGVFLPIMRLKGEATNRLAKFVDQFPDSLDLVVRSLRIGHPLATALQTIAREMPAPTNAEFEIVARQITYGKTPAEAVSALAARMPSPDVRFFSVAVQIHQEAGGNLGEILAGLSKIIRSRFQLFRKVKALTAEGRFSAYFLSAFPVVMIFAMNALQPGYYEKVTDFELFPHLVALTFMLLMVNVIAMRMMTKLEV
ncbi:MAG TPA: type II secretion system F family protein [Hyphomonadaceae bacterium]|nr:type II secretion system F family protein [Hyphomonadaceae bacterium]